MFFILTYYSLHGNVVAVPSNKQCLLMTVSSDMIIYCNVCICTYLMRVSAVIISMLFTVATESLTEVGNPDEDTWTPVRLTPNEDKSLWP